MLKHLQEPWIYLLLIFSILIVDYVQNNAKREACPPTRSSQKVHSPYREPADRSADDFCHNSHGEQPCIGTRP